MSEATVAEASVDDTICIAGNILLSKLECEFAVDLRGLLVGKADNVRAAFLAESIREIEKRGWAVVESAEKTTAPQ